MNVDPVLEAERAHLALARDELARMRRSAADLDASKASDAVSGAYLSETLARRVAALTDDPATTLFFGRIDWHDPASGAAGDGAERLYVGRRHVSDAVGDPLVIDWRAPVSTTFYRASRADPMGVRLRRRFGVEHGELTAYEDEHLEAPAASEVPVDDADGGGAAESILAREIERPRSGPMRDIVSTIQPEQDALVRADVSTTVCIQGAPGTGKTAVGLHRAAWLLYTFRGRLERTGVLVVGPNDAFIDHICAVLPSLGEARVRNATITTLLTGDVLDDVPRNRRWQVRAEDSTTAAVLKADARWAEVIRRAVWDSVLEPTETLVVPRGSRRWRVPASTVREILVDLRGRDVRYDAARSLLSQRLAHEVMLQLEASGDSPDDRVQDSIARSAPVKAYVKTLWPQLDAARVVHRLLSDGNFLAEMADGILTSSEQQAVLWVEPPRSKGSARWSVADLALLDEAADAIERTPTFGHVIVDEAQDLSPMQLRALARRCVSGSATVLGDVAQATTPWAPGSWELTMQHLGKPDHLLEELVRGFRVPASVIDYAARLLPAIAPGLTPPVSVRSNAGVLRHVGVTAEEVADETARTVVAATDRPGSIGVIATPTTLDAVAAALDTMGVSYGRLGETHGDTADHVVELVPAQVAKGLEFDRTIVVEPTAIAEAEPDELTGLRRLYVVLTRAVTELTVVRSRPVPAALEG